MERRHEQQRAFWNGIKELRDKHLVDDLEAQIALTKAAQEPVGHSTERRFFLKFGETQGLLLLALERGVTYIFACEVGHANLPSRPEHVT